MVGSAAGGDSRSKEAVGMMALHEALRNVCLNSDWTYSVFWTIRPRPYISICLTLSLNVCKFQDGNGFSLSLSSGGAEEATAARMLMWEDGFCRSRVTDCLEEIDGEDPVRKAFSKMSIQLYNYGEGWVLGSFLPSGLINSHPESRQELYSFCSPLCFAFFLLLLSSSSVNLSDFMSVALSEQTIAVIQAGHGLLQLGSCKIIPEDLHFVLRMRHMFESLGYQSGYFLSQLFSSTRTAAPLLSQPVKQTQVAPPQAIFNWNHPPLPAAPPMATMAAAHGFHPSARSANSKEDTHLFLLPHSDASSSQMEDMIADHEGDLKWPNGLSFFNALTGRSDDAKLLFGTDGLGSDSPVRHQQPLMASGKSFGVDDSKAEASRPDGSGCAEDYLGLESRSAGKMRKMESSKFKRSFTLPARMSSTSSSSAATPQGMEYRSSEAGIYSDIMETFLE
ncbi:hypothetical protein AXF42_Ash019664 [Apostasia shenzhenica]|uniref:Transcription factor MYC/MYB N-terminal domain-containing protein n=1 Tax=Apostasia shenzhenica TaxID=1088818 RepID=A0A2H9ZTQ5_9ASPA|nr:hypothetical protein AXF42_Ash019664 [Apostasia shenzhenica]